MFMQSHGGLATADRVRGKDAILSGPAGGLVGMIRMSALAGFVRVIGFDMGGTSTHVSHYAGEVERVLHSTVAGVRLRAPMLEIHTVAAGGGSVLTFDGSRARVGPGSAGANPGPACYRRGGPLTVTDANLLLGRIQPRYFPHVFGPTGDQPLDQDVVRERFTVLAEEMATATGVSRSPEEVADGFLQIAVANMANAVKKISVQKGHDVTEYVLTTFGGAGGQHACAVADALGIRSVLVPPMAGVLSALGIGLADVTAMREQSVEAVLEPPVMARVHNTTERLVDATRAELAAQGVPAERIDVARRGHPRHDGTDPALAVDLAEPDAMRAEFEGAYRRTYSFLMDRSLIVEAVAVEAVGRTSPDGDPVGWRDGAPVGGAADAVARVPMYIAGGWRDVPLYQRDDLRPGAVIEGPAIVAEANATTVVDTGWQASVTTAGHLLASRVAPAAD